MVGAESLDNGRWEIHTLDVDQADSTLHITEDCAKYLEAHWKGSGDTPQNIGGTLSMMRTNDPFTPSVGQNGILEAVNT